MYANLFPRYRRVGRRSLLLLAAISIAPLAGSQRLQAQDADMARPAPAIRNISRANERIEMTVNTSQVLTLQNSIPRIQVTNPDLLTATPLSKNEIQIAARKAGVTQVNLWDESGRVYTVDIIIYGDVRELEMTLKQMFPESTIRAVRLSQSLVLQGQVDRAEIVPTISRLAEDYAPKVINAITVGGAQQIALKVKVMEVNRTKLRRLGFDFTISGADGFFNSFVSGAFATSTVDFGVVDGGTTFNGFLDALQENQVLKTLADPVLTTVSGRPASFNVGREVFFQIGNGIAGSNVQSEKVGTEVNFVPIVLGNGHIRLEVRPSVSEIDPQSSADGILFQTKVSEVDTGVEMQAGQTLALAGLVQQRVTASHRGLPFVSDLPVIGIPFRSVSERVEEIELLILVTPEFVDAMDPHEVPPCGPGMESVSPSHMDLYCKGYIEVPACGPCGPGAAAGCSACASGSCSVHGFAPIGAPAATATDGPYTDGPYVSPQPAWESYPTLPPETAPLPTPSGTGAEQYYDPSASVGAGSPYYTAQLPVGSGAPAGVQINPAYQHILNNQAQRPSPPATTTPGLIGPIGYDVQK